MAIIKNILNRENHIVEQRRQEFIDIAKQWFKTPYIHGGNSFAGIDCSGFVCNVLRSIGQIRQKDDFSVHGLWKKLAKADNVFDQPEKGRIAFWFNSKNKAVHMAICTTYFITIQAARGNSKLKPNKKKKINFAKAIEMAQKKNAFVDYVPVDYRLDRELRFVDIFI